MLLVLLCLMIFSIKLTVKNINLNSWFTENSNLLNLSLVIAIFLLINLNNNYFLIVTTAASIILILLTIKNMVKRIRITNTNKTYWTGQIAHLGIAVFALGIILNVTQSYSTEKEINSFQEFEFNNSSFFVYDSIEENKPEKTIIKLPISNEITTKYTSLNIFRNSSQQAISSPAVFRSLSNDIYITVKFIDEDSYKLIVRNNYGILIMWIGLFISSISFIPRLKKRV